MQENGQGEDAMMNKMTNGTCPFVFCERQIKLKLCTTARTSPISTSSRSGVRATVADSNGIDKITMKGQKTNRSRGILINNFPSLLLQVLYPGVI